jgi:hypothetical protein
MEDRRATGARRQAQDHPWLTREGELVGIVLWAVGITTLAVLPDTGVFLPRDPPVFLGLKVVAAWLWLLVGAQCWQRWAGRPPQAP